DRGLLRWDDPVAKYWPEYAQHGKENTTIDHVLSHSAGVPYTDEEITYEDALHVVGALDKLSRTKPLWPPGSESGYHAITYGWLIEGIVRGADPMHRDLATFFNEEISRPF
ncbi:beta-lactamase, partial [Aphelenchoides avenae]